VSVIRTITLHVQNFHRWVTHARSQLRLSFTALLMALCSKADQIS